MTTLKTRMLISFVAAGAVAIGLVAGCSSDDSSTTGTTTPTKDSGTSTTDSGSSSTDSGGGDAGSTLYTRLGGHAGIAAAIHSVVGQELMDPEIASYFFNQVASPVPDGHPSATQIEACFTNLLASAAKGPEVYPGVPADNAGFQCRAMAAAHDGLGIPNGVFDKFVSIAATTLAPAVSAADLATIGGVLNGTKTAIVQDTTRDGGPYEAPDSGAGDAAGE